MRDESAAAGVAARLSPEPLSWIVMPCPLLSSLIPHPSSLSSKQITQHRLRAAVDRLQVDDVVPLLQHQPVQGGEEPLAVPDADQQPADALVDALFDQLDADDLGQAGQQLSRQVAVVAAGAA